MAKYRAYAEYKDSGLEWLGEIPSHWKIASLRFLVEAVSNGSTASQVEESETTVPISRIESISTGEIDMNKVGFVDIKTISQNFKLHKNDILLSHINSLPMVGNIALKRDDSTLFHGMNLLRLVPNRTITAPYYLFWLLKSIYFRKSVESVAKPAINQASVSIDSLKNIKLLVPNIDEQLAIANFLDHETTKIDHLIEKQQQLIELLKEKRQAVISHAVTKGLNPNVPMKDSGMKWLGEVPKHWSVSLIKYQCREITDGAHISPELENGEHLFISIRDIKEGVINFEDTLLTSEKSYQYLVHTGCKPFAGDILFSKDGTIGQTAITPSNINFVVASSLIIIRPNYFKVISEFLDLLLRSDVVQEQVESFVKGAALRRLSIQNLLKIWGVFPPIDEQEKIVEFVLFQLDKYKVLEDKAEKQVELLKERRIALISAAVTGKIDVRNWQAPTLAEAQTELSA